MSALTKLEAKALLREAREDTLVVGARWISRSKQPIPGSTTPVSGKVGQERTENNPR